MKIFCVTDQETKYLEECYLQYPEAPFISVLRDISDMSDINEDETVGVLFSSKFFLKYDMPLSKRYIEDVFEKYDVIMPYYSTLNCQSVYAHYADITGNAAHLDCLQKFITDNYFAMSCACEYIFNAKVFSPADTFIIRKKLLDEYVDFLENCIDELHRYHDDVDDGIIHDVIFRIFIASQNVRVKEEYAAVADYKSFINENEKIKLKQKYIEMRLEPLISFRKTVGFDSPLVDEFESDDDFDGKIPVFVCWFQGEGDMPPLIKACVESIRRHIPKDKAVLRLITLENVMRYVTFSEDIVRKFNEGIISYTHLSDVMRMELLYRYGGMWIDATYYISRDIPDEIFDEQLYTISFDKILWGLDVIKSRWSSSFWYVGTQKNKVIQFVLEGLMQYWEQENELLDYFLFDYILDAGYSNFAEIKDMIDSVTKSPYEVYDLQLRMNQKYTEEEQKRLPTESFCYKLNRRNEYHYYNDFKKKTVYGHILEEAGIIEVSDSMSGEYEIDDIKSLINYLRQENVKCYDDKSMLLAGCGVVSKLVIPDILGNVIINGHKSKEYPAILDSIYEWT